MFSVEPREPGDAFSRLLPSVKAELPDVLCLKTTRTVGGDNCVSYKARTLQIPPQSHRCHYVRARVAVHEYEDGALAVFHGAHRLASYDPNGRLLDRGAAAA